MNHIVHASSQVQTVGRGKKARGLLSIHLFGYKSTDFGGLKDLFHVEVDALDRELNGVAESLNRWFHFILFQTIHNWDLEIG